MNIRPHFSIGQPVPLNHSMHQSLIVHLQALTCDDLYDRFGMNTDHATLVTYVQRIDFVRDICLGIFEADLSLSGMIHLCLHGPVAELGASVAPGYRGRNRGLSLFRAAFDKAVATGIQEIHLATGHPAACRIAQKLGYPIRYGARYPKAIISLTVRQEAVA